MAEVAEREARILNPQRMGLREHKRQDWSVVAEEGTSIEQVLQPQYWAHVAAQMSRYDRVEVLVETGEWMLELVVLGVGRNWAQVHVLHRHGLEAPAETMPSATAHKVDWKGPHKKFCVVRIGDSALIQEGFDSRDAANEWLKNHERMTG